MSSATAEDLASGETRTSTRRPTRPGRASSRWCPRAGTDRAGPAVTQRRSMSGSAAGSGAITSSSSREAVDRPRPQRLVGARVDASSNQRVELVLEVELVGEPAARLEVRLQRSPAGARRRPWPAGRPARRTASRRRSSPQNAANASVGRPPWAWMPAWRSQTSVSGRPPSRHRQRAIPASRSGVSLREHQRAGAGARVAQAARPRPSPRRVWPWPTGDLAPAAPTRSNWQSSPGPIDRPLKRPRPRREQRPHLAQIVIDDRLRRPRSPAAPAARGPADPGSLGSSRSSRWISSLNASSFDARRRTPIHRRRRRWRNARRTVLRCTPRPPDGSRADRQAASRSATAGSPPTAPPRPPRSSRARSAQTSPGVRRPPDTLQVAHFSTGAGGPVFTRRRQASNRRECAHLAEGPPTSRFTRQNQDTTIFRRARFNAGAGKALQRGGPRRLGPETPSLRVTISTCRWRRRQLTRSG